MLIPVFGTPSQATARVIAAVRAIADVALQPYRYIDATTADAFRKSWAEGIAQNVIVFGDIPDAEVTRLLLRAELPVIIVVEPPAEAAASAMRRVGLDALAAVRATSRSLATIHDLALSPPARRFVASREIIPAGELVAVLAATCGLALAPADRQRIENTVRATDAATASEGPRPDCSDLASVALAGFDGLAKGVRATRFTWPPGLWLTSDPQGQPLRGPVSLIGFRRCVVYGPYLHLPAGRWIAEVAFDVDGNRSGNRLKIDVNSTAVLAEGTAPLPKEGRFRSRLAFTVDEPREPIEIRLFIEEGAIEGALEFHGATVTREE